MGIVPVLLLATLAQTATVGTNAQDKSTAQSLLADGATLYEHGNYLGALEKFNAAYAAYPSSKILFNIGQANRFLGRPIEARDAYRHFLDEVPNASREERADAQSWLDQIEKSLGQLAITCQTDSAEISVDGKSVGKSPLPKPIWATPGHHQVTATKTGDCPMVETADVLAGGQAFVELKALHGALPSDASHLDLTSATKNESSQRGWWLGRKWTWVAAGSTVVLAGAAATVGWSMMSRFDDLKKSCGNDSPGQLGCSQSDLDSLHTRKVTANVLWGLTGAAAATTAVLFFVEGRPVGVAPMVGQATGVTARVGF